MTIQFPGFGGTSGGTGGGADGTDGNSIFIQYSDDGSPPWSDDYDTGDAFIRVAIAQAKPALMSDDWGPAIRIRGADGEVTTTSGFGLSPVGSRYTFTAEDTNNDFQATGIILPDNPADDAVFLVVFRLFDGRGIAQFSGALAKALPVSTAGSDSAANGESLIYEFENGYYLYAAQVSGTRELLLGADIQNDGSELFDTDFVQLYQLTDAQAGSGGGAGNLTRFSVLNSASTYDAAIGNLEVGDTIVFQRFSPAANIEATLVGFDTYKPDAVQTRIDLWLEEVDLSALQANGSVLIRRTSTTGPQIGFALTYEADIADVNAASEFGIQSDVGFGEALAGVQENAREKVNVPVMIHEFSWTSDANQSDVDARYLTAEYLIFEGWIGDNANDQNSFRTSIPRSQIPASFASSAENGRFIGFPRSRTGSARHGARVSLNAGGSLALDPAGSTSSHGEVRVWTSDTP